MVILYLRCSNRNLSKLTLKSSIGECKWKYYHHDNTVHDRTSTFHVFNCFEKIYRKYKSNGLNIAKQHEHAARPINNMIA